MNEKSLKSKRRTIGVLLGNADEFYQSQICRGIKKIAEEKDFNLLFFHGMHIKSRKGDEIQQNVTYQLLNTDKIDGLIVVSGSLLNYIGVDEYIKFLQPYRKIPLVSIAVPIPGMHSILLDNKSAIQLILDHLIQHHHYSSIAFISGPLSNLEAVSRYEGYKTSLKKYYIPFDENLIFEGDFTQESGIQAVDVFFQQRKIKPQAIIASNDEMAVGAFLRMKQMRIEVGKAVALTGFDNTETAKIFSPSFTTIGQSTIQMGSKSMEVISDLLDKKEVPLCTYLSGELIVRESCGCFNILSERISPNLNNPVNDSTRYQKKCKSFETSFKSRQKDIISGINEKIEIHPSEIAIFSDFIESLSDELIKDIKGKNVEGKFVEKLNSIVSDCLMRKNHNFPYHEALSHFRSSVLSIINDHEIMRLVQDIFYASSIALSNILQRCEALHQFYFNKMYIESRQIIQSFNAALTIETLIEVLPNAMSRYGLKQYYLCLYDTPVKNLPNKDFIFPSKIRMVLGCNQGEMTYNYTFDTVEMLPAAFIYQEKRNTLLFFALFSGNDHFGYIVCDEEAVDRLIFETVREQISNALKSQMLFNERAKAEEQLNLAVIELKKYNRDLHQLSVNDALTGLYNRRGFYNRGESYYNLAILNNENFILFFGDLDGLKHINDTYGHREGDEAIYIAAQILMKSFRNSDIVSRMGGDEFTIIAVNISSKDAVEIMLEHIKENLNKYNSTSNKPYKISISLGYSIYSQGSRLTLDDLIKEADRNLYEQKNKRKKKKVQMLNFT